MESQDDSEMSKLRKITNPDRIWTTEFRGIKISRGRNKNSLTDKYIWPYENKYSSINTSTHLTKETFKNVGQLLTLGGGMKLFKRKLTMD